MPILLLGTTNLGSKHGGACPNSVVAAKTLLYEPPSSVYDLGSCLCLESPWLKLLFLVVCVCVCAINGAPESFNWPLFNRDSMRRSVVVLLLKPWFLFMMGMTLATMSLAVPKKRRLRCTPLAEEDTRTTPEDGPKRSQHLGLTTQGVLPPDPGLPSDLELYELATHPIDTTRGPLIRTTDDLRYSQPPNNLYTRSSQGLTRTPHLDDAQALCVQNDWPSEQHMTGELYPESSEVTLPNAGPTDPNYHRQSGGSACDGQNNATAEDDITQKASPSGPTGKGDRIHRIAPKYPHRHNQTSVPVSLRTSVSCDHSVSNRKCRTRILRTLRIARWANTPRVMTGFFLLCRPWVENCWFAQEKMRIDDITFELAHVGRFMFSDACNLRTLSARQVRQSFHWCLHVNALSDTSTTNCRDQTYCLEIFACRTPSSNGQRFEHTSPKGWAGTAPIHKSNIMSVQHANGWHQWPRSFPCLTQSTGPGIESNMRKDANPLTPTAQVCATLIMLEPGTYSRLDPSSWNDCCPPCSPLDLAVTASPTSWRASLMPSLPHDTIRAVVFDLILDGPDRYRRRHSSGGDLSTRTPQATHSRLASLHALIKRPRRPLPELNMTPIMQPPSSVTFLLESQPHEAVFAIFSRYQAQRSLASLHTVPREEKGDHSVCGSPLTIATASPHIANKHLARNRLPWQHSYEEEARPASMQLWFVPNKPDLQVHASFTPTTFVHARNASNSQATQCLSKFGSRKMGKSPAAKARQACRPPTRFRAPDKTPEGERPAHLSEWKPERFPWNHKSWYQTTPARGRGNYHGQPGGCVQKPPKPPKAVRKDTTQERATPSQKETVSVRRIPPRPPPAPSRNGQDNLEDATARPRGLLLEETRPTDEAPTLDDMDDEHVATMGAEGVANIEVKHEGPELQPDFTEHQLQELQNRLLGYVIPGALEEGATEARVADAMQMLWVPVLEQRLWRSTTRCFLCNMHQEGLLAWKHHLLTRTHRHLMSAATQFWFRAYTTMSVCEDIQQPDSFSQALAVFPTCCIHRKGCPPPPLQPSITASFLLARRPPYSQWPCLHPITLHPVRHSQGERNMPPKRSRRTRQGCIKTEPKYRSPAGQKERQLTILHRQWNVCTPKPDGRPTVFETAMRAKTPDGLQEWSRQANSPHQQPSQHPSHTWNRSNWRNVRWRPRAGRAKRLRRRSKTHGVTSSPLPTIKQATRVWIHPGFEARCCPSILWLWCWMFVTWLFGPARTRGPRNRKQSGLVQRSVFHVVCILDFGCIYSKITFYGSLHKQGWWFCLMHHLKCLKIAGGPRMFMLVLLNAPPKMLEDCGGSAHVQACWQQRNFCCTQPRNTSQTWPDMRANRIITPICMPHTHT